MELIFYNSSGYNADMELILWSQTLSTKQYFQETFVSLRALTLDVIVTLQV